MSRFETPSDELLTGLIDGRLSDEERAEIEGRLTADPALAAELSTLQMIRRAAAALPQPPSIPDLSDKVLRVAASRAAQSGGAEWIDRSLAATQPVTASGRGSENAEGRRKTSMPRTASSLAALAALAAGLLLMLSAFRELRQQPADGVPPAAERTLAASDRPDQDPARLDAAPDITPSAPEEAIAAAGPSLSPQGPRDGAVEPASDPSLIPQPQGAVEAERPAVESIASSEPIAPASLPELAPPDSGGPQDSAVAESMASVDAAGDDPEEQLRAAMGVAAGFLLIIDVSLDAADPSNADAVLAALLRRYDIAYGSQIDADPTVIRSLEQSRLVETLADDTRLQPGQDRVDLFFVKARASRLDAALLEMMADTQNFRQFAMDLAMDPPALELFNQLRGVQEAELRDDQAPTVSVASPLNRTGGGEAWYGRRRQNPMSPEDRRNARSLAGMSLVGDAGNPVSYALLVVRRGGEQTNP